MKSLASTKELVEEISQGRMVILMDDPGRENEGDLVMAASDVTAEHVNFMAKHGRGLICLTLTRERCRKLNLSLAARDGFSWHGTNFTESIEAATGVTTGISAADRARTIQVAVAADSTAGDLSSPGHVFPLMAHDGGVLFRAGHTEAGCDLARLAHKEAAAVIVEILNEDGTMARRPQLEEFATEHNLKIGAIADLIQFRLLHEQVVERLDEQKITTSYGVFNFIRYRDTLHSDIHFAMVAGEVSATEPCLVRVHLQNPVADIVSMAGIDAGARSLHRVLRRIAREGGVLVVLCNKPSARSMLDVLAVNDTAAEAQSRPGRGGSDLRGIGLGAQILRDAGVRRMRVIGIPRRVHALDGFGLEICGYEQNLETDDDNTTG